MKSQTESESALAGICSKYRRGRKIEKMLTSSFPYYPTNQLNSINPDSKQIQGNEAKLSFEWITEINSVSDQHKLDISPVLCLLKDPIRMIRNARISVKT